MSLVLLNKTYFSLNYAIESGIGTIALLATIIILNSYWYRLYSGNNIANNKAGILPLITLSTIILLDLNNFNAWTLVQFECLYLLLAIIYLIAADLVLKGKISEPFFQCLTLVILFIGDAVGITAILAFISYLLLFDVKKNRRLLFKLVIVIMLGVVTAHGLIDNMHPHTKISKLAALNYILQNIPDSVSMLLKGLAQSMTKSKALEIIFQDNWEIYQYLLGLVVGCFIMLSVCLYIKNRQQLNTSLPFTLILLTCVTIGGVYLTRFPEYGDEVIQAGRYIRLLKVWLLGSVSIFFLIDPFKMPSHKWVKITNRVKLLTISCLTTVFLMNSYGNWKFYESRERFFMNFAHAVKHFDDAGESQQLLGSLHQRCNDKYCEPSILYLKKNKLSIFRGS
ncbi:MAG: hypothetical protein K0U68_02885 [Gammaproteobacteria bacterium]|nr:hypothetical protein [Gammaproteobacteria bacterium]